MLEARASKRKKVKKAGNDPVGLIEARFAIAREEAIIHNSHRGRKKIGGGKRAAVNSSTMNFSRRGKETASR